MFGDKKWLRWGIGIVIVCSVSVSVVWWWIGKEKKLCGEIIQATVDGEKLLSFVIQTDKGRVVNVEVLDKTYIINFVESMDTNAFRSGEIGEVQVEVTYKGLPLLDKGQDVKYKRQIEAMDIYIQEALNKRIVLEDGTIVEVWEGVFGTEYRLEDGAALLDVRGRGISEAVQGDPTGVFKSLDDVVQEKIIAYYAEYGVVYDIQQTLEKAYGEYSEDKNSFQCYLIDQSVGPVAISEHIIYIRTSVLFGEQDGIAYEKYIGKAFARATGEVVNNMTIFKEPESIALLLKKANIEEELLQEMLAAFKSEDLIVEPEGIKIHFTRGTLRSKVYSYTIDIDYDEEVLSLMHDWAIPEKREE